MSIGGFLVAGLSVGTWFLLGLDDHDAPPAYWLKFSVSLAGFLIAATAAFFQLFRLFYA